MSEHTSQQKLKIYLDAQLEEIYKYKWCMGIELNRDPLDIYTLDEICMMWIDINANSFRNNWILEHGIGYFNGNDSAS